MKYFNFLKTWEMSKQLDKDYTPKDIAANPIAQNFSYNQSFFLCDLFFSSTLWIVFVYQFAIVHFLWQGLGKKELFLLT